MVDFVVSMPNITNVPETLNTPESAPSADPTITNQVPETAPAAENPAPVAEQAEAPQTSDAKSSTADSSNAVDKDAKQKRATLLDVVKSGLREGKPDSNSSAEGSQRKSAEAENAEGKASQDDGQTPKDDLLKQAEKLPFHNHPRWKEMVSERDSLKPKADQYEKITTFMSTNRLSAEEMAQGMQVMALMKNNPVEAYKVLQGYVQNLAPLTGEVLPEDLKKEVEDGFIPESRAKELARLQAERQYSETYQRQVAEEREREYQALKERQMYDAVVTWEAQEKAKDPDWDKKYEMVMDRVRTLMASGRPQSSSEAVEVARRALSDINSRLRPLAGRNVDLRSPTSSLSSASTRPSPRSLEDVVRMGLQT